MRRFDAAWRPLRPSSFHTWPRSFASAAVWQRRAVRGFGGLALTASTIGIATLVDEGCRRCADFWICVLPIFAHYKFVDRISHPSATPERAAEFERLHEIYSPIVRDATLRLRGYYLKVAQFFSMRDDYELGLGHVDEAFKDWSSKPIGSASIGQVYLARLRSTGEDVAIKVQMPGAERLFRVDIRTLKIFTRLAFPWAVDHISELDALLICYAQPCLSHNMEKVRNNVSQRWGDRVIIPKTFPELCTRRVLTMQFLDGEKLVDGMLRRVRVAAQQANRDPDEWPGERSTFLLFPCWVVMFAKVLNVAGNLYRIWLNSEPMERLRLVPVAPPAFQRPPWLRIEQRGSVALLKAIPESLRAELVSQREVGSVSIIFKILTVYQPGGLGERTTLLKQLVDQKVPSALGEWLTSLRAWRRWLTRVQELGIQSPDPVLLLATLDRFAAGLAKHSSQVEFRLQVTRAALRVDVAPTENGIQQFAESLVAEGEAAFHGGSTAPIRETVKVRALDGDGGGKDDGGKPRDGKEKVKEIADSKDPKDAKNGKFDPKQSKQDTKNGSSEKPVCRHFLSESGCKKGQKRSFPHEWKGVSKQGRCWTCGSTQHMKPDCPVKDVPKVKKEQVFVDGLFNADPHPGNVMLLHDAHDSVGLIDFGQVKELSLDFRVQLAKLIIALSRRDEAEVVRLDKEMGSRTQLSKADVRYRVVTFWLDRDTDDVTGGQSFHNFLAWAEEEDPLLEMPRDLHLVMRCSCMIRNLALSFGIRLSTAEPWHAATLESM
eukprot:g23295.t1